MITKTNAEQWLTDNFPDLACKRAVEILRDTPSLSQRLGEVFVLMEAYHRDRVNNDLLELRAEVDGLRTALESKNDVFVQITYSKVQVVAVLFVLLGMATAFLITRFL